MGKSCSGAISERFMCRIKNKNGVKIRRIRKESFDLAICKNRKTRGDADKNLRSRNGVLKKRLPKKGLETRATRPDDLGQGLKAIPDQTYGGG